VSVMDLEEMLGVDLARPQDQLAHALVAADSGMLDDLIALRVSQKLSQTEVAARMGVTASAVSRIESGDRDPHLSTLRRYAMALGAVVQHNVKKFERTALEEAWSASNADTLGREWSDGGRDLAGLAHVIRERNA
jgi:transcriptional regulator with XRE-family HTH domain